MFSVAHIPVVDCYIQQPFLLLVQVTNTGSVTSDVSALAFVSTGAPGQPISELFDFQVC